MAQITEPWDDPEAEKEVLTALVFPLAQSSYAQALHRWTSIDAKAFGFLAVVAAAIAGLAAAHDSIRAWWLPAVGCLVAGVFFIAALWPRDMDLGPDVLDLHDEARLVTSLEVTRLTVEILADSTESVEAGYDEKSSNFQIGLAILAVSLISALPVVLFDA